MTWWQRHHTTMLGGAWMSIAVAIWASWLVLTSSGKTTDLAVLDLAGLRALVPTLVLAPLLWRARSEVARIGVIKCLLLSLYGLPFTLCVGYGLTVAPVAHAGALVPGMMPLFAAGLGRVFVGWKIEKRQAVGYAIILLASALVVLRSAGTTGSGNMVFGHVLFLLGAVYWACFTITMRSLNISPYLATAIVGGISSAVSIPLWALTDLSNMHIASGHDIAIQVVFQGVFSGLVSLFAFAQAIRLLGARASVWSAATPGVATLLAMPILGQIPDNLELMALVIVVTGLAVGNTKSRAQRPKAP